MTTDKRRYSVRLLHAGGPTLFEVRRLCTGFVDVDVSGALPDAAIRIAVLHCVGRPSNGTSTASHGTPVINISLDEAVGFPRTGDDAVEHYDVSKPRQRLTLLARLASLVEWHGTARHGTKVHALFSSCQLYEQIALIQRTFSLHLSERGLADRVGMNPSTLFRLFQQVGRVSPARFLQWVRMHELAKRLAGGTSSVELIAHELGFHHAESARRTLRNVVGMSIASLRTTEGLVEFERQMVAACERAAAAHVSGLPSRDHV